MIDRIRCEKVRDRILSPGDAARLIQDGMTVAVSGFSPSGNPKIVPLALAEQVRTGERSVRVSLLSGASTGSEIDNEWGALDMIDRRLPYITSAPLRKNVNSGGARYLDQHLGMSAQNTRYGFYGSIDIAIIEAVAITEEGNLILSTAVGCSQTYVDLAEKVIVEVNLTQPAELEGMHDIYEVQDPPHRRPIPLVSAGQRIGVPYVRCPAEKIAAVVYSDVTEKPAPFAAPDENSQKIADNIVAFLEREKASGGISVNDVPLQSGIGSVANAVLVGLKNSEFEHLTFYSEVIQDGILALIDAGKADFASATSLTFSDEGREHLLKNFENYRHRLILRDSEISNHAEVIRRLGVIAMNTAVEADIYGNVNSSQMNGTTMYNGIGGSGDYARNASITIFMTSSTAKGGRISSIVPMASHVDHTEHDVDVIVTEQGYADLRGRSPKERAELIIENCAHPDYRPLLRRYFEEACVRTGGAQTPHMLDKCFSFHQRLAETGTMLEEMALVD